MGSIRIQKINDQLKREISDIILRQLKDPRVGFVTVSRVRVSADLHIAKVYVSVFSKISDPATSLEGLNSAADFIRAELNKRIKLRFVPKIQFYLDDSLDYAEKIEYLLQRTREE